MKNYYLILCLKYNATAEEIKKAYREMALKFHPDRHNCEQYYVEKFQEIHEAYAVLSDPMKKRQYDIRLYYYLNRQTQSYSTPKPPPRPTQPYKQTYAQPKQPQSQAYRSQTVPPEVNRYYTKVFVFGIIFGVVFWIFIGAILDNIKEKEGKQTHRPISEEPAIYKFQYFEVNDFNIQPGALKNADVVQIIYAQNIDYEDYRNGYVQFLVVAKSTGDTVNVLSSHNPYEDWAENPKKLYAFFNEESDFSKLSHLSSEESSKINPEDLKNTPPKRFNIIVRIRGFEDILNNHFPTVIGVVGDITN